MEKTKTRIEAAVQAVAAELARTGEDQLVADELNQLARDLAEIAAEYPLASAHDLACYLLYPQF